MAPPTPTPFETAATLLLPLFSPTKPPQLNKLPAYRSRHVCGTLKVNQMEETHYKIDFGDLLGSPDEGMGADAKIDLETRVQP
ncbi:hypothetical protein AX14_003008 [Amanita brunnescens Koide BX004]|nr:hypothetical protein AX14_003008 [Amanita brunnescens Koide BX004]